MIYFSEETPSVHWLILEHKGFTLLVSQRDRWDLFPSKEIFDISGKLQTHTTFCQYASFQRDLNVSGIQQWIFCTVADTSVRALYDSVWFCSALGIQDLGQTLLILSRAYLSVVEARKSGKKWPDIQVHKVFQAKHSWRGSKQAHVMAEPCPVEFVGNTALEFALPLHSAYSALRIKPS